ncbi:MAG: hypothetical protein GQ574_03420 [Crocinitomix sp.]|nr:hypothetical protein [Crocinitomix sp.]
MKNIILLFATLLSFCSFGQGQYVDIPRTKISIPQLEGFKLDSISAVLINTKNNTEVIQFYDLDGGNFESNTRSFSKEGLEEKGVSVPLIKDTVVAQYQAVFAVVSSEYKGIEMAMLVFGNEHFSAMVNAIYSFDRSDADKEKIQEAMLGIKYDIHKNVNPFEGVKFKSVNNEDFQYESFATNLYIYSNQKDTSEKVIVLQLPYSPGQTLMQVAANSLLQGKSEGWEDLNLTSETYCHADKTTCYAIGGTCTIKGEKRVFHYQFITDKKSVVIAVLAGITGSKSAISDQAKYFTEGILLK